ncbi:MAG: hypothetical protein GY746_10065 [Gammaproteobacteria bacterium]|nr:hypothetical protein [Gammaproteobacteria bacterium]
MAMVGSRKIGVLSNTDYAEETHNLTLPNPGDIIMAMIFAWALFCFFLVLAGKQVLGVMSRQASSLELKNAIANGDEAALTLLMVVGSLSIFILVLLCLKYRKAIFPVMLFGLSFAAAQWLPLHDFAASIKYLCLAVLASFAGLFLLKNFWILISTPYIRILVALFIWIAIVSIFVGGRFDDFWFVSVFLAFAIGVAIGWCNYIDDIESLCAFNRNIAWAGLVITFIHLSTPIIIDDYLQQGRFRSYDSRATAFGVFYAPVLIAMFWMGMFEKRVIIKWVFQLAAVAGVILILWSGTRSAAGATVAAVFLLWWVFKTRILLYVFMAIVLGLSAQIIGLSEQEDFGLIADRVEEEGASGRFDVWVEYSEIILRSPVYGHSSSGVLRQIYAEEYLNLFTRINATAKTPSAHNSYIGITVRFGIVALVLYLMLIFKSLGRARNVLLSEFVPAEDKQVYVLPVAILLVICITGLTEDIVPENGKGNLATFMAFPLLVLCEAMGAKLLRKYSEPMVNIQPPKESDNILHSEPL